MDTRNGAKTVDKWKVREKEYVLGEVNKIKKRQKILMKTGNKMFCQDCQELVLVDKVSKFHEGHKVKNVDENDIKRSTKLLLRQLGENKKEAQYHFTDLTLNTLTKILESNKLNKVLCLGAPTVMEHLNKTKNRTLLMDIDLRFSSFFREGREWIWYNMFNHHMFVSEHKNYYEDFLEGSTDGMAVVLDPPFGGKVELIATSLNRIMSDWNKLNKSDDAKTKVKIFWIFPYFMESKIVEAIPELKMSDYQVNYDNHKAFQDANKSGARKQGSPVRIFTNLDLAKLELSSEKSSYKFCQDCDFWTHKNNSHCFDCGACTSKSGAPYRHCAKCRRCVKQTWRHCDNCGRCALPDHPCQLFKSKNRFKK